jgi:hemolysin III
MTKTLRVGGHSRPQTLGEEIANAVSHGVGALLAVTATVFLLVKTVLSGNTAAQVSCALYGASMILLYLNSCLYHALTPPSAKGVLQIMDHCSIFLLILGTYSPITLLIVGGTFGHVIFLVIAAAALLGIVLNVAGLQRFKKFCLVLYVLMGWLAVLTVRSLWLAAAPYGVPLLLLGGVAYTLGVVFYRMKERPYMHFIWHLFVIAGSALHFSMIYLFCVTL